MARGTVFPTPTLQPLRAFGILLVSLMNKNPYTKAEKSLKYKSFEKLYKEAALPLMKFLIKRTGGDFEASEEVFSRTVESALNGYYNFENKSSFFTWVCRIGLNKIADYYRDQVHHRSRIIVPLFEELAQVKDSGLNPEEQLAISELRKNLHECLDLLPDEKRQLLQLRYWEDLSVKKIAAILGISERAAEGKLYRARADLRFVVIQKYPDLK